MSTQRARRKCGYRNPRITMEVKRAETCGDGDQIVDEMWVYLDGKRVGFAYFGGQGGFDFATQDSSFNKARWREAETYACALPVPPGNESWCDYMNLEAVLIMLAQEWADKKAHEKKLRKERRDES